MVLCLRGICVLFFSAVNLIAYKEFLSGEKIELLSSMSFDIMLLIMALFAPHLLCFSKVANEVFACMGYDKPKMVDLHKTRKTYRKKNNTSWTTNNNFELWY